MLTVRSLAAVLAADVAEAVSERWSSIDPARGRVISAVYRATAAESPLESAYIRDG